MLSHNLTLAAGLACLALAGCVERRFLVTTDPPGAIVQVNGKTVGAAPVDVPFVYYGTYRLTIVRDGYETLVVDQPIPTPWYEYFPLEFVSENLLPWTVRDLRKFHYKLEPLQVVPPEAVLDRSEQMRSRGRAIGAPPPGAAIVPGVPALGPPTGFSPVQPGLPPPPGTSGTPIVPQAQPPVGGPPAL